LESYHIPWVHGGLSEDVEVAGYEVACGRNMVVHTAPQKRRDSVYGGLWTWLAPCTALNVYATGMSVERILPEGPGATRIDYTFLFESDVTDDDQRRAVAMCEEVTNEDGAMCETVQVNLCSGPFGLGPLSPDHELGIAHFHRILMDAVGASAQQTTVANRAPC